MPSVSYVGATNSYPFSAVVSILVTYSDGSTSRGSGAVVGDNDVLTASHVVDNDPVRGKATSIEIIPGQNGNSAPFGSFSVSHTRFRNVDVDGDGAGTNAEVRQDYAILTVDGPNPIGTVTGHFGMRSNAVSDGGTALLNMAGYPSGYQNGGPLDMVRANGVETYSNGVWQHSYQNETGQEWSGASGSAFYVFENGQRFVVGVFSTSNSATFIDTKVFRELQEWMRENDEQRLVGNGKSNKFEGGFKDDVLIGKGGGDQLFGREGADKLLGGQGRDKVNGGDGADNIRGDDGGDRLEGKNGKDSIEGGKGDDVLLGGAGRDVLKGGTMSDRINGGADRDLIEGDKGQDVLTGGKGADTFLFEAKAGNDRITDFQQGIDTIAIDTGVNRFKDLKIKDAGDNVKIIYGNNVLTVEDSRPGQFQASDFDFI